MAASMLVTLLSLGLSVQGAQNRSTLRGSFSPYDYELSVSQHTSLPLTSVLTVCMPAISRGEHEAGYVSCQVARAMRY